EEKEKEEGYNNNSQDDESSLNESLSDLEDDEDSLDDEEYMTDDESLEDEYLEEDEYLDEKTFLQREMYPFKEAYVEEKVFLKEKAFQKHLEEGESTVPSTSHEIHPSATTPLSSEHDLKFATSSYHNVSGISASLRDQSSQTEWAYKSKMGASLRSKRAGLAQDSSSFLALKSHLKETFHQEAFWETLMSGPFDKGKEEAIESLPSSYQSVFSDILSELAYHHQLEEDLDMPLNKMLEGDNRKKLGILLKKNFEKYRETILWIVKKREATGQKMPEKSVTVTYLISTLEQPKKPEQPEAQMVTKGPRSIAKTLVLDTGWIRAKMKLHQSDGKIAAYQNGKAFQILFPDGTGQLYYPSGNLALLISCKGIAKVTYIVLEDSTKPKVLGLATNSGHATFYDGDGKMWLCLSKILGFYFPKDKHQKAWNWWNLRMHVHAPPVMSISLKLNKHIHIQISSQDKIVFCFFTPKQKRICLNMGTRFKIINPKLLKAMEKKVVLETDTRPTSWKIQGLLGKISQCLNLTSLSELEAFIAVAHVALEDLRAKKSRIWF
ncbi:glutamate-rich protein 6B, partial [Acomys russatus]|uniref:glutamate-rich protein 6B n=1 Tax=Acomys russatus TaxID=60746 RepID=UPI0021E25311